MSNPVHIVSTRRLTQGGLARIEDSGLRLIQHDFIQKVIDIPNTITGEDIHNHIVLTSKSGVKAFLKIIDQLHLNKANYTVSCIGHATKDYVHAAGLNMFATAPNASSLAEEICNDKAIRKVTHICSNLRRNELSEKLTLAEVSVHDVVAYRTLFSPVRMDQSYEALLFFSPSGVDSFLSANTLLQLPCFCIGQTTADHAKQKGYSQTFIPDVPAEETLLTLLLDYFINTTTHVKE